MLFSRSVNESAERDLERLRVSRDAEDARLVQEAYNLVVGILRFDPHLQGIGSQLTDLRVVVCGPIRVSYRVFPLDDRLVEIRGVSANVAWVR